MSFFTWNFNFRVLCRLYSVTTQIKSNTNSLLNTLFLLINGGSMDNLLAILGVIALGIFFWIIGVFVIMWGWSLFAVPVFGMKALTFSQAFGLSLVGGAIGKISYSKK